MTICKGITIKNKKCKNSAINGKNYCRFHLGQNKNRINEFDIVVFDNITSNLDYSDILSLCKTNQKFKHLCKSKFISKKMEKKFLNTYPWGKLAKQVIDDKAIARFRVSNGYSSGQRNFFITYILECYNYKTPGYVFLHINIRNDDGRAGEPHNYKTLMKKARNEIGSIFKGNLDKWRQLGKKYVNVSFPIKRSVALKLVADLTAKNVENLEKVGDNFVPELYKY